MNKLQNIIKNMTKKEYLPLWIFAVIQVIYHIIMREPEGSDAMWFFRNQLDAYSLKDYLMTRYETWASRLFIETVLVYISRNVLLWKVLDWFFWVFLAWAFVMLFPKEKRQLASYIIVGFLLIYPMWDLRTAGWIATSANYSWPLALGVFSLHGIAKAFYGEKTSVGMWMLYGIAALYAANMEQMSAILLAVNGCAIVYFILEKAKVRLYGSAILGFVIAALEFVFIMTCPGNAARKNQEIINWMPNFASYNLLDKINMGFVDTMHHMISSGNLLFLCYVSLLAVLVFIRSKDLKCRMAAMIPVGFNLSFVFFSDMLERYLPTFYEKMDHNSFVKGTNYHVAASYIPTVIYLLMIGCMLLSLITITDTYFELFAQGMLMALALATRVIMGFTPTIYVSQERTFFYLYMILGISGVCFILSNMKQLKEQERTFEVMKLAGGFLMVAGVLVNLVEIGSV